ncbi:MAG: glutamate synthase large subunit [Candidatus Omnitrophota bacterium]|nr:glutamate synthase large subunit [Candidatus Omnitrophota bacterium]
MNPPKNSNRGLYDPRYEHDACGVGFLANIKGKKSHEIIEQAITVLLNLDHRGACGCEADTGDGAGILIQKPHSFFHKVCAGTSVKIPDNEEDYGVGMVFLTPKAKDRQAAEKTFEAIVREEGQAFLGWRDVPTDNSSLGPTARSKEPFVRQIFIGRNPALKDALAFERKLYVIRRRAENALRGPDTSAGGEYFYVSSLSQRTLVYKGMLLTKQVKNFYPDLNDPEMKSALALVHSRFSTNTFPNWDRAQPLRYICHNGEINTLRGNVNWMHARQALCETPLFGDDIKKLLPIIDEDGSDSSMFDNCLEFLTLSGRSLPHAVMMMIPEPWSRHESMSDDKKAFYEYHSCMMEPWDGPASIAFTDGVQIGAVLDRNGLRPSRYYITKDDMVIMASEVGVLDVPPERVLKKGRLEPGRMFLVDTREGRIISDEEIKTKIAAEQPYRKWLNENIIDLQELPEAPHVHGPDHKTVLLRQKAFGYTFEDLRVLMAPMAQVGVEAVGSMGNDTPLAALSNQSQPLFSYFKQLFAQVTNPPIDCIREEIITSTVTTVGSEGNLLNPRSANARQIKLTSPVLTNEEFEKLRHVDHKYFKAITLPILYDPSLRGAGLEKALTKLYQLADRAVRNGHNLIILSDRGIEKKKAPIPSLLAVSGLHHHLIREGTRTEVAIILESGEPREVHHFAVLVGYGASAVNPYLAFETLDDLIRQKLLTGIDHKTAVKNFAKAVAKGVVKTMSKMGISTVQSYCGAQIFEAVGINRAVIDKYFRWTSSRVEGIGMDEIAEEVFLRHKEAFPSRPRAATALDSGGQYQWRKDGEYHMFNPETVHQLQTALRNNSYEVFQKYAKSVNEQSKNYCTLRGLLEFKFESRKPVPIEEVEPVSEIVKRFKTGAMSYGSISKEAHEALAIAMNRIGGKSNTGEGGEDPARYTPEANGDSKNSAIKQVASGRFGVTSLYLTQAKELQIKMAQGAKPGEGGQLPGTKVYPWIAKVRSTTAGVGLISPPPHHDIYSIEDLAQLIHDLKNANHHARISVKLVAEVGVGTIAAGVSKAHADVVLISGYDGGTGASPQSSIKHAGIPWELGLADTHQTLVLNNLRSRIAVETDGQLKTGRDVVVAALLGAEEFGFATAPLVGLGCIMMRVCHLNTCPVGVATQNPELRKKFTGDPAHVVNFMNFIAQQVRELMAQLGFRTINEMIGRTDALEANKAVDHWKAKGLDFSKILFRPEVSEDVGRYCQIPQDHGLDKALDNTTLLALCEPALARGEKVNATVLIKNTNRVVGTILGSELTRRYGAEGLPDDTIHLKFNGSAGQSFGAFVPRGITLELEGDANDYFGKGLGAGKLIVYPPKAATFVPEDNILIGNVAFYGATGGRAYIRGLAGERFCVRNSGVQTVVEGIGDHGCEYMTGGRVVILGATGRNFAAGMSGGIAYVLDVDGTFPSRCNVQMVGLEKLEIAGEIDNVRTLIEEHAKYTDSKRAKQILDLWEDMVPKFVKVIPHDYKRMLEAIEGMKDAGLDEEEAIMTAFEENASNLARVGGN